MNPVEVIQFFNWLPNSHYDLRDRPMRFRQAELKGATLRGGVPLKFLGCLERGGGRCVVFSDGSCSEIPAEVTEVLDCEAASVPAGERLAASHAIAVARDESGEIRFAELVPMGVNGGDGTNIPMFRVSSVL